MAELPNSRLNIDKFIQITIWIFSHTHMVHITIISFLLRVNLVEFRVIHIYYITCIDQSTNSTTICAYVCIRNFPSNSAVKMLVEYNFDALLISRTRTFRCIYVSKHKEHIRIHMEHESALYTQRLFIDIHSENRTV